MRNSRYNQGIIYIHSLILISLHPHCLISITLLLADPYILYPDANSDQWYVNIDCRL